MRIYLTDFSFWLLLLTTLSLLILGIDALFFRKARKQRLAAAGIPAQSVSADGRPVNHDPVLVDYSRSFLPVLALVLVVRSFIFEPFRIPSDSMMPTLLDGDFIFVSKFSYGLRFPVFNFKLLETGNPQRGDVVVFKLPADPSINYIKRLIGLPGDHIHVENDHVFINGQEMGQVMGGLYNEHGYVDAQLATEDLGTVQHRIMFAQGRYSTDYDGVVPADHYFFMGDNRDNSQDSRFPQVGFVPAANLVGRAKLIWLHWKFTEWPDLARIGTIIH